MIATFLLVQLILWYFNNGTFYSLFECVVIIVTFLHCIEFVCNCSSTLQLEDGVRRLTIMWKVVTLVTEKTKLMNSSEKWCNFVRNKYIKTTIVVLVLYSRLCCFKCVI